MANQILETVFRMVNSNKRGIIRNLLLLVTILLAGTYSFAQERVKASSNEEKIIGGGYMQTSFTVARSGQLTADTHSWTNNRVQGFHGTVRVIVCNADGECYISPEKGCGVAGKLDPSGPSNRHCYWQVDVPNEIAVTANRYIISQGKNEVPLWNNPDVKRFFDQAGRLIRENKEDANRLLGPLLKAMQ